MLLLRAMSNSFISCLKHLLLLKHVLLYAYLALSGSYAIAQDPASTTAKAAAITVLSSVALIAPEAQTINAVQAIPGSSWQVFDPRATYPTKDGAALWVKLTLSVNSPPQGWTIKLPKPYLDRVELYLPSAQVDTGAGSSADDSGTWTMQAAGDRVAHRDWPVRGLHPQFALPALAVGEHVIFLKIASSVGFSTPLQLHSLEEGLNDSLDHLIRSIATTALVLCIALISIGLALVYRDRAYAWYCAYALSAALTSAAYSGLANYLLWPNAIFWPDRSIHVCLLATIWLQIMFCYMAFEPQKLQPRFKALVWIGSLITVAGMAALWSENNILIFSAGLMVPMVLNWIIVVRIVRTRLRLGDLSAKLWMLAYIPLTVLIVASTLEGFGLQPKAFIDYYWPIYALAFEVPVLLLALMLRARTRDAHAVTQHTLQQLDPLTGFVIPRAYEDKARPLWEHAGSLDVNLAVVYVQVTQPDLPYLGGASQAPGSERIVRVLRTVFRQEDTYAQLTDNIYAVLMPGKALGEPLQTRLTRLIAQMHMLSRELKTDYPLRTRIAACTTQSLPMPWSDVHRILLEKFDDEKNWEKSTIRMVSKRHNQRGDDDDLSNFWARAVQAEANANGTSAP